MSEFYRKFLLEDFRRLNPNSSRHVSLAAFGKHPGWDDHIEDLGLETEGLIVAKKLLYVQGIGGQIDSGEWEKLDPSQQIPVFKHVFAWVRGSQFLLGRMWSSSDGKGRTRYPMIVCAHLAGASLSWALDEVLPRLQQIEEGCVLTRAAAEVRQILHRYRGELRYAIGNVATSTSPPAVTPAALGQFVAHPALGRDHQGWHRILYQMQSQMAPFAPGRFSLRGDLNSLRPQQIRVPACGGSLAQSLGLWLRFFQSQMDPGVPLLLTLPMEESWLDVTAGEPAAPEFFCLRASPKALPLVSEIPYNLDTEFRAKAEKLVADFQAGGGNIIQLADDAKRAEAEATPSVTQRWFRWFSGGAALLPLSAWSAALWLA